MSTMLFRMNQPVELVNELVYNLPEELFTSSTSTFLDPAMGKGDYLVGVAKRLREYGHTKKNILNRLHGIECNELYVQNCLQRTPLEGAHIYTDSYEEILKWEPEMKFDCVLGNPPFNDGSTSRDGANNRRQGGRIISRDFINMSIKLAKSHVVMISSVSKIWSGASKARNVTHWADSGLSSVTNVAHWFKTVDPSLNIGCFTFNITGNRNRLVDEFAVPNPPASNLGSRYHGPKGSTRSEINKIITHTPGGKYKIFETAAVLIETNNKKAFDKIKTHVAIGKYRVVFSKIRTDKIGRVIIASPGDKLSSSAGCVECDSRKHAIAMKKYLESDKIVELAIHIKDLTSDMNSRFLFERLPDFK